MSKNSGAKGEAAFELTRDEAVYFRRFFQRMAAPYLGVMLALVVLALALPQVLGSRSKSTRPVEPVVVTAEPAEPVYGRAEIQSLVLELLESESDGEPALDPEVAARIERIEKALEASEKRIGTLAKSQKAQSASVGGAVGERVENVETRVEQLEGRAEAAEQARTSSARSTLDRLYNLEEFRTEQESRESDAFRALLSRLDAIESRLATLER